LSSDPLLQPSLGSSDSRPIYSAGALVAAAFFGGSISVCIMATLNSIRLNRMRAHAVYLVIAMVAGVAVIWFLSEGVTTETTSRVRLANRGMGFALTGLFYLLYQRQYRSMKMLGGDPPSPWIPVILASLIGWVVTVGIALNRSGLLNADG